MKSFPNTNSRLKKAPVILISPNIEVQGDEFGDTSISLSETYQRAILEAGGIPLALAGIADRELIAESVSRCDGVLFTGGDDIHPEIYGKKLPTPLQNTVKIEKGNRDLREFILVDEVFRQGKPVLGICRGHQVLNVALGGSLIVDIPSQRKTEINHRQMPRKSEVVHEAQLTRGSLLAKITGKQRLGVNSTHHQAIGTVAGPLRATAVSDDGIVEGMELKSEAAHLLPFFLSVQFHPERLAPRHPEHQAIFNGFVRACGLNRNRKL